MNFYFIYGDLNVNSFTSVFVYLVKMTIPPPQRKKTQKFIANFSINKKRNQILIFKFNRPFILISLINLTTKSTKLVLNEYREPILLDVSSSECAWSNFTAVNIWSNLGLCTCINYKQSWSLLQTNI